MSKLEILADNIQQRFGKQAQQVLYANDEVTVEVAASDLHDMCQALRDEDVFKFDQLIDVCGVDYLHYGLAQWTTDDATSTGFERGVDESMQRVVNFDKPRFAAVYHLLSVKHNQRIRLRCFTGDDMLVPSVVDIWDAANWFEREAFDLYGIIFEGHPDLRRILTDYGFVGHPFRKDFPVSGHVEMRYDATEQRVVYQPVSIKPRVLVPKVIRQDSRYTKAQDDAAQGENDA